MAISSPQVVPYNPNAGAVQHPNTPAQFAEHMQRKREFTSQVGMGLAQMDPAQRIMVARQNPDLVSSILRETNLSGEEADALTTQMAEGLLPADQQVQNILAAQVRAGSFVPGRQPEPQPQPEPEPTPPRREGVPKEVTPPEARRGQQAGRGVGTTTFQQQYPNPASRGGTLKPATGETQEIHGYRTQQHEAFDEAAGGLNLSFNQALKASNELIGSEDRPGIIRQEDGEWKTDWGRFNSRFGQVNDENKEIVFPEDSALSYEEVYGDLTQDEAIRFRAHVDHRTQMLKRQLRRGDITEEQAQERYRQLIDPESVQESDPVNNFMWNDNFTTEQIRDIQTYGDGTVEDMRERANQLYAGQIDETVKERDGDETVNAVSRPGETFLNTGNQQRIRRAVNNAREQAFTTDSGRLRPNPALGTEDMNKVIKQIETAFNLTSKRSHPRSEEEANKRLTELLNYTEHGLSVFTGGETGPEAFEQARNFLNEQGYMEARIAMMENELEMQRVMNEHNISQDKIETGMQMLAFRAQQEASAAETEEARNDSYLSALGTARKVLEMSTKEGELNRATIRKEWNDNPAFRDGYKSYMEMYGKFLQNYFPNVEITEQDITGGVLDGAIRRMFTGGTQVPALSWGGEGAPEEEEMNEVMKNLSPEQQEEFQRLLNMGF